MITNTEIATLLRQIAAAYQILNENRFRIIAYERAADSIEHLSSEAKDLWDDGKLKEIPGIGQAMADYLDELFRTGKVRHFEAVLKKVPASLFPLLSIPGLGPKKAYKLAISLKFSNPKSVISDLAQAVKSHKVASLEGFGEKSEADILEGIQAYQRGQIKEKRMVLPEADQLAQTIISYLKKLPSVRRVDSLGSLRRQVSTIGDIDIAVATTKSSEVIEHFCKYPHKKLIEKGPTGASLLLTNGRQVDLRVQKPAAYGAMLQYFTGSKNHNIKLREYALEKGLSLSEYGIKNLHTKKLKEFSTEEAFYQALDLSYIPPELREDQGEIEAALRSGISRTQGKPPLVKLTDVKGDLHVHTSYDLQPSHDLGADSIEKYLDQATKLGYEYLGISDHNPSLTNHSEKQIIRIMSDRKAYYEEHYYSWVKKLSKKSQTVGRYVQLVIMLEVDILTDGQLALPEMAFNYVDAVIASLHSSFTQEREKISERILKGITAHPKVRILGHPTCRMLGSREGVDADWEKIFKVCRQRDLALEINAYPQRLDLPDSLVFEAKKQGLHFCINTDAHATGQMNLMRYGVSVARRGWAVKDDIINTLGYNDFRKWLVK